MHAATVAATPVTTIELVLVNHSSYALSFTPQITRITPAANGSATLGTGAGTGPVPVPVLVAAGASTSVTLALAPAAGLPVTVTLELDGAIGGTAFSLVQTVGVDGRSAVPVGHALPATWPLSAAPAPTLSGTPGGGAYQLSLTIGAGFALLPATRFTAQGGRLSMNGQPFFACGVNYSPTPIGGATFQPNVGDWFAPPWWTGAGGDLGSRDIPLLQAAGANALRTYFAWYWYKNSDLAYLQGITQSTPMSVYKNTQYPYTVSFDHTPFLDACHAGGLYVVLGIAIEGGNCFNFAEGEVSSAYQNFYLQTAQKLATLYRQHPAVLGFCMGNEQNSAVVNVDSRTWLYYQAMYQAIKAAAPDKLALIAFQDDQTLYNGTLTVMDQAGQQPPTVFNGKAIESVISQVVDVWGLNSYAGINSDFPVYQANVVEAANGAYARPLLYQTDNDGKVSMLDGSKVYPAYPFTHDGGQAPDWPEERWGLYGIGIANNRPPFAPSPTEPDTLSPRTPYVQALRAAYQTIAAAYAAAKAPSGQQGAGDAR